MNPWRRTRGRSVRIMGRARQATHHNFDQSLGHTAAAVLGHWIDDTNAAYRRTTIGPGKWKQITVHRVRDTLIVLDALSALIRCGTRKLNAP